MGKSVKKSLFQAWDLEGVHGEPSESIDDAVSFASKNDIRWVAQLESAVGDELTVCYDVYLDLPVNMWSEYPV